MSQSAKPPTIALLAGATIGVAVFLWTYLASFLEHQAFPDEHLLKALPVVTLTGWRHLGDFILTVVPFDSALSVAFVVIVGLLVWVPWFGATRRMRLYGLWVMLVSAFVVLISIQVNDFALWHTLAHWLPGFGAVRDPKRVSYMYELAVVLVTGLLVAQFPRRSVFRLLVLGMVLSFVVTHPNSTQFTFARPMDVFNRYVEAPIAIDPSCRSFFIRGASKEYMSRTDNMWSLYNNDAIFVATRNGLPTLNGYSAFGPPGWDLANPQDADFYRRAVAEWVRRHDLHDVCELDIEAHTMTPYRLPPIK